MPISKSDIFAYGYCHLEVIVLPTDINIRKCQFCLRILTFGSVSFAYGHWHLELALFDCVHFYPKGTIIFLNIHIRKPIILNFFFWQCNDFVTFNGLKPLNRTNLKNKSKINIKICYLLFIIKYLYYHLYIFKCINH